MNVFLIVTVDVNMMIYSLTILIFIYLFEKKESANYYLIL